jgi:alcohol dehydrogenase
MTVAILAHLGVNVVAGTGKDDAHGWLRELGAAEVIPRSELEEGVKKPLLKQRWAGVIDSVGGDILFNALKSLEYGGTAVCCGLAGSPELHGTVFPFILRNVNLIGVDSVEIPVEFKQQMWQLLADDWRPESLGTLRSAEVGLSELPEYFQQILAGRVRGRVLVLTS